MKFLKSLMLKISLNRRYLKACVSLHRYCEEEHYC